MYERRLLQSSTGTGPPLTFENTPPLAQLSTLLSLSCSRSSESEVESFVTALLGADGLAPANRQRRKLIAPPRDENSSW